MEGNAELVEIGNGVAVVVSISVISSVSSVVTDVVVDDDDVD